MGLKIRQVINVLIDAPDKDKPFIVECRRDELNKCKYEWGQLEISKVTNCGHSSVADAYVRPEDKWWKDKGGGRSVTINEVLNKFKEAFPFAAIDDYRPICHELFTDEKEGLTIWLKNGDVIEYYPKAESEDKE